MLDISELKPGNIISFKGIANMIVNRVKEGCVEIKDNGVFPYNVFEGIRMKEPWLDAWGFTMTGDGSFDKSLGEFRVTTDYEIKYNGEKLHVPEFVHQFQNVYFEMTGKKLVLIGKEILNKKECKKQTYN